MRVPLTHEDQALFDRAYREHYPTLVSFVRRRVADDTEAADIAQEAYLRVLRYRDSQDLAALKSLLFQIAVNLITDRARLAHVRRRADHVPLVDELPVFASDPSQYRQIAGEQDLNRLLVVVERLPRKCRDVFVLRRFEGLSHQEIAQRLGIGTKAVERYVAMAASICRQKIWGGERS
jgi:RNA polymerase sigma factor (sigma-70 family)